MEKGEFATGRVNCAECENDGSCICLTNHAIYEEIYMSDTEPAEPARLRLIEVFETRAMAETVLKALESVNVLFNSYKLQPFHTNKERIEAVRNDWDAIAKDPNPIQYPDDTDFDTAEIINDAMRLNNAETT
jgi:hypothetical protein